MSASPPKREEQRKKMPCKFFFGEKKHCMLGDKCHYSHEQPAKTEQSSSVQAKKVPWLEERKRSQMDEQQMEEKKMKMRADFTELQKAKAKKTLTLAPAAATATKKLDLREMLNEEYKAEKTAEVSTFDEQPKIQIQRPERVKDASFVSYVKPIAIDP